MVRRNAFGRQVDSFEADIGYAGWPAPLHAVFIRAPWVEEVGEGVEVLGRIEGGRADGRVVAVRQGALLATAFHPEVTGDLTVHEQFLDAGSRAGLTPLAGALGPTVGSRRPPRAAQVGSGLFVRRPGPGSEGGEHAS